VGDPLTPAFAVSLALAVGGSLVELLALALAPRAFAALAVIPLDTRRFTFDDAEGARQALDGVARYEFREALRDADFARYVFDEEARRVVFRLPFVAHKMGWYCVGRVDLALSGATVVATARWFPVPFVLFVPGGLALAAAAVPLTAPLMPLGIVVAPLAVLLVAALAVRDAQRAASGAFDALEAGLRPLAP